MDNPMSDLITHREVMLELVQMYAQTHTSQLTLHQLKVEQWMNWEMDALVTQLRACVLGEDGGDTATRREVLQRKIKPRWLPKWLWNRIYSEYVTVSVTAKPKWTYPHSDILIPDLHSPVRIIVPHGDLYTWGDDYG